MEKQSDSQNSYSPRIYNEDLQEPHLPETKQTDSYYILHRVQLVYLQQQQQQQQQQFQ